MAGRKVGDVATLDITNSKFVVAGVEIVADRRNHTISAEITEQVAWRVAQSGAPE